MGQYTNQDCLTEIEKISTVKANIKSSIENKGVTVASDTKFADYPSLIDSITASPSTMELEITENGKYYAFEYSVDGFSHVNVNVSGGGSANLGPCYAFTNGTYLAGDQSLDGFNEVYVNVQAEGPNASNISDMNYSESISDNSANVFPYTMPSLTQLTHSLTITSGASISSMYSNLENLQSLNLNLHLEDNSINNSGLINLSSLTYAGIAVYAGTASQFNKNFLNYLVSSYCSNLQTLSIYMYDMDSSYVDSTYGLTLPSFKTGYSSLTSVNVPLRWTKSWTPNNANITEISSTDNYINGSVSVKNCPNLTSNAIGNLLAAASRSTTSEFSWTRTLTFNHTVMDDSEGTLASWKTQAEANGFTITGLTINPFQEG